MVYAADHEENVTVMKKVFGFRLGPNFGVLTKTFICGSWLKKYLRLRSSPRNIFVRPAVLPSILRLRLTVNI